MARGIRIPVGVNQSGGTAMIEGDAHKKQLITTAMSAGESANAFQQDINLKEGMIFGNDTPLLRSRILRRLRAIFVDFESQNLFRLLPETIEWEKKPDEGELILSYKYIDLETDKPEEFSQGFSLRA